MRDHQPINTQTLLSHIPLFSGLKTEELARIAQATREIRCEKGDTLFQRGDPCNGFHVIVYGQVKLAFTSAQGTEKVVEVVRQGQSFGEAIMFLDKPYIVFAQALESCLLLHVPKTVIHEELQRDHSFARKMMASMAMRLHQLMTDVEAYSLHSGMQRVIGYLLNEVHESNTSDSVVLELPVTKGVIASRLNLTQEHFSRMLHELSENGLISVNARQITIPSLKQLTDYRSN